MTADELKAEAGRAALDHVEPGMRLGIGTGSTAEAFIHALAERVDGGLDVVGVPTSERTAQLCMSLGVRLASLDEMPRLDLAIDGADEVGPDLTLIKGAGGALLREKIVAHAADRMLVIADASKRVDALGAFPLPIEVSAFGVTATRMAIETVLAGQDVARRDVMAREDDSDLYRTDGGNLILDLHLDRIGDARALSRALLAVPGVVDTGLFLDMTDVMIFGRTDGGVEVIDVPRRA